MAARQSSQAVSLPAATLRKLVQALGNPDFAPELLRAMQELVDVQHLSVVAFDDRLEPRIIGAESAGRSSVAKTAGRIYERSLLYRHDPNVKVIKGDASSDEPLLLRLRAKEIGNHEYRTGIFDRFKLIDRLSILDHTSGHWHAINFYREQGSGEFRPADIAVVKRAAGVIAAMVAKHFTLAPPATMQPAPRPSVEVLEALVAGLDTRLTTRQTQVCARALMGMTNVAVGLDLGIQVPTVATLRKRAYATLKISSLNELFALCLQRSK